jgi:hypothetical protein
MDVIYSYLMKMVYERSQQKQRSELLADVPLAQFNDRLKQSRRYQVFGSRNGKYQVEILDSGRKYVVDLEMPSCDCGNLQEYRAPCTHVIATCKYATKDPLVYMHAMYTTKALKETYSHFLNPISIKNLTVDEAIQPLVAKRQRGRPKTKRIRKRAWNWKPIRCRLCGVLGDHNKRRCTNRPLVNGRQQRAQDWDDILSSSESSSRSSSESSSGSSSDSSSLGGSEYSEDSVDRQFVEEARQRERQRED